MIRTRGVMLVFVVLSLAGTRTPARHSGSPVINGNGPRAFPDVRSLTQPSRKQVIRALLSIRDLPLSAYPSCVGAGSSRSDRDIGDYVSGWLSELGEKDTRNWIDVVTSAEPSAPLDRMRWRVEVTFRHDDGDDRWGWGVRFLLTAQGGRVVPASIECIGAG